MSDVFQEEKLKGLTRNRELFDEFIYTPITEVIEIAEKRLADDHLKQKVNDFLQNDIPEPLKKGLKAVLFRQVFTPNYELIYFMELVNALSIEPMFLEYYCDKFSTNNPIKHSLGKLKFQKDFSNRNTRMYSKNVIEFNSNSGKRIKDIQTNWDQSLIEFHHELLKFIFPNNLKFLFDTSEWLSKPKGLKAEYQFSCLCGAKNCRKKITWHDWKNPKLQKKYQGYFQWYLEEKIKRYS